MFIEILNYGDKGCKAKCPTCPQVVSGPNNGPYGHLMFEALNRLKNKFTSDTIPFSLQNDIADLPHQLAKFTFNIQNIDYSLGCNIKFPFDDRMVKSLFSYLESNIPNVKFAFYLENRGFLANYKAGVFKLIETFASSKIKDISIACHNNSMRIDIFKQNIEKMFGSTVELFKQILLAHPTNSFRKSLKEGSIPFPDEDYKQFISELDLNFDSKRLQLTERVLAFEENTNETKDLIGFYKDYFATELGGATFDKERVNLAFTSIGVRVNHRSIDIRNPFLWLSYDEFFELLEEANSLEDLCLSLKSSMGKTEFLSCKISEINYETIHLLADSRRQLVL